MSVATTAYISKNGLVFVFFTSGSPAAFTPLTAVNSAPSFYLNGSGTAVANVQGPVWTNTNHSTPWVAYQLPTAPLPTDHVTLSASSGWATTEAGTAPASTLQSIANYVGQLEPAVGYFSGVGPTSSDTRLVPGFNDTTAPTMTLGMNMGSAACVSNNPYAPMRNWLKRMNWTNTDTYSTNVRPTTLTAAAVAIPANFAATLNPQIDNRGQPTATGTWTFLADDMNPSAPMVVALTANVAGATTSSTLGNLIGGVQVGKTWSITVAYPTLPPTGSNSLAIQITVTISHPTGGAYPCAYTLENEMFLEPVGGAGTTPGTAQAPENYTATIPDISPNLLSLIKSPNGNYPSMLRWMDCTSGTSQQSNYTFPTDIPRAANFTWRNATVLTPPVQVSQIRYYDIVANSPNIYFPQAWNGTTAAAGGSPDVYVMAAPNYYYMNRATTSPGNAWIAEVVCSRAHGFHTGQAVVFGAGTNGITVSSGGLTATYAGSGTVSANNASTSITFSTSQSSLAGKILTIIGDTSSGSYTIQSGGPGTAWTISPAFGGTNISGAAWATANIANLGSSEAQCFVTGATTFAFQAGSANSTLAPQAAPGYMNFPPSGSPTSFPITTGSGTCSIVHNTTTLTFSTSQSALTNLYIQIDGDSTGGIYQVVSGSGTSWTLASTFLGATIAASPGSTWSTQTIAPLTLSTSDTDSLPYEFAAKATGQVLGTDFWCNIPQNATDALVQAIATAVLNNFPAGRHVWIELSNEVWNNFVRNFFAESFYLLNSEPNAVSLFTWYCLVAAHVKSVFQGVFAAAGRGSEVKLIIAWQYGLNTPFIAAINSLNSANPGCCPVDAISVAPYFDCPADSTIASAFSSMYCAASTAANNPYGTPIATGTTQATYSWTPGMCCDVLRHYVKYGMDNNGPSSTNGGFIQRTRAAANTYVPTTGQPVGFVPVILGYECCFELLSPKLHTTGTNYLQSVASHDIYYHPDFYYVKKAYLQALQFGGYSTAVLFSLMSWRSSAGGSTLFNRGEYMWMNQARGLGASNQPYNWTSTSYGPTLSANDQTNQTVTAQATADWIDAVNSAPPSTSSAPARRYFPGLNLLYRSR